MDNHQAQILKILKDKPKDQFVVMLTVLEAALIFSWGEKVECVPEKLVEELIEQYGQSAVLQAVEELCEQKILIENKLSNICIKKEAKETAAQIHSILMNDMVIDAFGMTMHDFLERFLGYLKDHIDEMQYVYSTGEYVVTADDKEMNESIRVLFSPFCIPAAADYYSQIDRCVLVLGPFAGLGWEKIYPYFDYEECRKYIACCDPYSLRKMNTSKSVLAIYLDWFLRDDFGKRLYVETAFVDTIHEMGYFKYDDEF